MSLRPAVLRSSGVVGHDAQRLATGPVRTAQGDLPRALGRLADETLELCGSKAGADRENESVAARIAELERAAHVFERRGAQGRA